MLYTILKWLLYLTVKGYFHSIHLKGRINIPNEGPVIYVANHNSAFMDPILLGVHIKRPIYFLARGESFTSRLVSLVFNWLHMIPIYKPEITPDKVYKNKAIFQRCFDHLRKGKTIMIFPEGLSMTVRKLRPLKTGSARIALGAEALHNFELGVKIVPIGINYSNPHDFRSDVFINFGKPIHVNEYKSIHNEDPVKAVQDLTATMRDRIEELMVLVRDDSIVDLVNHIERLYRNNLKGELSPDNKATQDFYQSREIVKVIAYNKQTSPKKILKFQQKIKHYFKALDRLKVSDSNFKGSRYSKSLWKISYFIIGFPLFMYGFLVNIIPYSLVALLSRQIKVREDFMGSMKLAIGMFVFLVFYIVQILFVSLYTNWIWGLSFALSLYPSGLFAIKYLNQWYRFREHLTYLRLASKRKGTIPKLHAIREALLMELDEGRKRYLKASNSTI